MNQIELHVRDQNMSTRKTTSNPNKKENLICLLIVALQSSPRRNKLNNIYGDSSSSASDLNLPLLFSPIVIYGENLLSLRTTSNPLICLKSTD